jgi:hypothetical protein
MQARIFSPGRIGAEDGRAMAPHQRAAFFGSGSVIFTLKRSLSI